MLRLAAHVLAAAALAVFAVASPVLSTAPARADPGGCVVVDTDLDIDDLMSIPAALGARHVAAIVTTEGYTLPGFGAAAVSRLLADPGQRPIPVIVGAGIGRSEADIAATFGDYVPVYRALMHRLNDFLPQPLPPAPASGDYVGQVAEAVAGCPRVDVLLLGAFTSFAHYGPAIRPKLGRVVITGRPPVGDQDLEAGESFNCLYDRPSCVQVSREQLPGLVHTFVDVPRTDCDTTPNRAGCVGTVYGPTLAMVRRLGPTGLPHTLAQILLDHPDSWALETWEHSGYGGRSMFWDQSTTLALLEPALFRPVGAHVETVLSPVEFADAWTRWTNLSAAYA